VPLVTAQLLVLSGSEVDPPQRAGLASMTAGLLTRGTARHSAPALAAAAEALGGSLESAAGWNQSSVGITVTTPLLSPALALLAEVVRQPSFAQAELDRYRAQALDDLKVEYSQPGTLAALVVQRAVFGAGTYGHPVAGTPKSLPRATRADVVKLHAAHYRPDNAVLVLAGDIDLPRAEGLARQHFGNWKAPRGAHPASGPAVAALGASGSEAVIIVNLPGAGQAAVALAVPAVAGDSPERMAGLVSNAVLGAGYSSRLNQEIRIKRGLSYSAGSRLDARRQAGALRVSVQTKNPSAAEVVALVSAELDALIATSVPADELAARKATLIGDYSRSLETTQGLGSQVAALVVAGLPTIELTQRIDRLTKVDAQDVQRFAASYLARPQRRLVVVGVASEFEPALRAQHAGAVVVQQADLDLDSAPAAKR
jgi:zinc protease